MSLSGRPIINVEQSRGYVWDTGTLDWIPATPGAGGGGGSGTEYTEDAAAVANPVGPMTMIVRKDTPASEVTTDGDNIAARGTTYGAQYVTLLDTAGSPVAVGGGTQYVEDAVAAANPTGTALILVRADALAGLTTNDGDNVAGRATDKGEQYVKHVDSIPVTDNAGSLTVDNPVLSVVGGGVEATAQRVTIATDSTGVLSVDDNGASLTVDNPILSVVGSGLEATAQRVTIATDSTGVLSVDDNGGSLTVDNNGTFVTQENGAALTSLQLIDDPVVTLGTTTYTETTSKGQAVAAVRRDADTTLVDTTNEFAPLQVDARGCLKVEAFSGETLPVSLTSTTITGTSTTKEIRSATSAVTTVNDNAANVTLLASNANRLGASITNDSSAKLHIKLGATATTASYSAGLDQFGYYEVPAGYTGIIDGIWASDPNDGAARITELTA